MSDNTVTPVRATRRHLLRDISDGAGGHDVVPAGITISADGVLFMDFDTIDELLAWAKVVEAMPFRHREPVGGGSLHSYYTFTGFMGYHGVLTCTESAPVDELVREETAAGDDRLTRCQAPQSPGCVHPPMYYVSYADPVVGVTYGDGPRIPATTYRRVCGWCVEEIPDRLTVERLPYEAVKS